MIIKPNHLNYTLTLFRSSKVLDLNGISGWPVVVTAICQRVVLDLILSFRMSWKWENSLFLPNFALRARLPCSCPTMRTLSKNAYNFCHNSSFHKHDSALRMTLCVSASPRLNCTLCGKVITPGVHNSSRKHSYGNTFNCSLYKQNIKRFSAF